MVRALLIISVMLLVSCGSRKREVEKSKEQIQSEIKNDVTKESETITKVSEQAQEFIGEVADVTKPASVQTETKGAKVIQTFTNFKNVSNSAKTASKEVISDVKEVDKSEQKTTVKKESKALKVERKTGFPWWLLLIIVLGAGVYLYVKNINPLNFFKKLA